MEKFVPYEKLSKRRKRELDRQRRGSWGALKPVTRKPQNPKAYNRKQARKRREDAGFGPVCLPWPHKSSIPWFLWVFSKRYERDQFYGTMIAQ